MTFPEIRTARLRLRPLTPEDLDDIHRLWTDPGLRKYLWDDEVISREKAASVLETSLHSFEAHGLGLWAVFPRGGGGGLMGFCGYMFFHDPPHLELLYGIDPSHWGRGLAAEVVAAMIRYGFEELALNRVEASADAGNVASIRVMERAGMKPRRRAGPDGQEAVYYVISHDEYTATDDSYQLLRP